MSTWTMQFTAPDDGSSRSSTESCRSPAASASPASQNFATTCPAHSEIVLRMRLRFRMAAHRAVAAVAGDAAMPLRLRRRALGKGLGGRCQVRRDAAARASALEIRLPAKPCSDRRSAVAG